ncbi:MAG TPA: hotdog fold thioesterase [Candidatus Paceibacterota bacterium]|nr:hotdog fold thioesterase [Verrucomicrobiota bacterium]HSA10556.1 hotdog fold thioesterase [Candidatus Paceibacterota bacterium]
MSKETRPHTAAHGDAFASLQRFFQNDRFADRCSIELLAVSPGYARAKMTLHPHHLNGYGTVQGGAIFTLADFAFAAASNSHGTVAVAINVSITFMKAGQTGTLWADAREISRNFKLGSYTVEVKDDAGELVALFQGMAYRKSEKIPG